MPKSKLTVCRVCEHQIARNAKTCPHCGARKPAASKVEAGLDAAGAGAVKLGLGLIGLVVLGVLLVACIAVVA